MIKDFFRTNHLKEHEKKQERRREQLGFQEFVIHRFLVILLYVVVSEYIVKSLLDRFMIPAIQMGFFDNGNPDISLSFTESLLFLILLLCELLLKALYNIIPVMVVRGGLQALMQGIENMARSSVPAFREVSYNIEMEVTEAALLFLSIFAIIVLFVTPLAVAAFWFSKIIMNEVRRIEQNKEALRKEYEEKRNLMLSDIAHDLRTPITTIAGYAKALNDGMVTEEEKKKEYLDAIENKSERMSDLINLLFEYVKLDSTGFELNIENVDLPELLRENAALLYSDVEDKGMELEISIPEESCMVKVDSLQISRVVTNLISNAIRHNERGTTISLKMVKENETITIIVADDGTPIAKEIADHIFEPFIVGDKSRKTKGGSGLGLSIAKKIVDMHDGSLEYYQNTPEYKKAFIIKLKLPE